MKQKDNKNLSCQYASFCLFSGQPLTNDRGYHSEESIISDIKHPVLTIVSSEQTNGVGILIIPGGGYRRLVHGKEGLSVAKYLASKGYSAFVLSYRMPVPVLGGNYALSDANRALEFIKEWSSRNTVSLKSLGVIGFSAGGHVASGLVSHNYHHRNFIRPDFLALLYPVISMSANIAHRGCRDKLIGSDGNEDDFSIELNIPSEMPPVFIIHATDDDDVCVEHSLRLADVLLRKKISVDIHLYEKGGHGFGLSDKTKLPVKGWKELFLNWLSFHNFNS
ncbi:alpha/beta hydrolase [Escherichia coli]|uniref:alpha/beta hydrolase n=1 Tax=Citrobacter farmeri TaxID=67824 RepID=UPI00209E5CA1|nr:alpha/beta hydrolase [Citrobacter farmeri]EHE8226127.1 alpha/beta hydrolase [Escherichia coli]MCP1694766.1 acetyl esterase/lipase [Citrobacter farmeri]MCW2424884.1 acetyl esterase/lipase [Citrobacter farmeri]